MDDAAEDEDTSMEHNTQLKKIDTLNVNIEMLTQSGKYLFINCFSLYLMPCVKLLINRYTFALCQISDKSVHLMHFPKLNA